MTSLRLFKHGSRRGLFLESIRVRILIFFIVGLIPLNIFAFYAHRVSRRYLDDKSVQLANGALQSTAERVERQLLSLYQRISKMMDSVSVVSLFRSDDSISRYQRGELINSIIGELRTVRLNHTLVDNITLVYPGLGFAISDIGYEHVIAESDLELLRQQLSASPLFSDDRRFYSLVRRNVDNRTLYFIRVHLSSTALLREIETLRTQAEEAVTFIANQSIVSDPKRAELVIGKPSNETDRNERVVLSATDQRQLFRIGFYSPLNYIFRDAKTVNFVFVLMIVLLILVVAALFIVVSRMMSRPLRRIGQALDAAEEGNFAFSTGYDRNDEFATVIEQMTRLFHSLDYLVKWTYNQEELIRSAQFKHLQSQIKPHFLFNAHFMLHRLIKSGNEESALALSAYIGHFFHYVTRDENEIVDLSEEVSHVRNYLEIQKMRFGSRLNVEFEPLSDSLSKVTVPKLILQPVVENCFVHGFEYQEDMHIRIIIKNSDIGVQIIVADNGKQLSDEAIDNLSARLSNPASESTGLVNVKRRLVLSSDIKGSVSVSRSDLGGLQVAIQIITRANTLTIGVKGYDDIDSPS